MNDKLESFSKRCWELWTETGSEHFAYQNSDPSQIFEPILSVSEKILKSVNVVVSRQVKQENSSIPVVIGGLKTLRALSSLLPLQRAGLRLGHAHLVPTNLINIGPLFINLSAIAVLGHHGATLKSDEKNCFPRFPLYIFNAVDLR